MQLDHTEYSLKVGGKHRKKFGQYFTHPLVAQFMVEWVLESGKNTLFDPAFGLGAFLTPVSCKPEIEFSGCESDPEIFNFLAEKAPEKIIQISNSDYFQLWGVSHNNIVCNPPYMRFQNCANRDTIVRAFRERMGLEVSGYTNIAAAFLMKSIYELGNSGRMAYIMPLEFLNTGYGATVKKCLIEHGHLMAIIKLDCEKDVFPEVITTAGIILYDKAKTYSHVNFYTVNSLCSLDGILGSEPISSVERKYLAPEEKWMQHFSAGNFAVNHGNLVPMSSYGRFRRGIATGANDFFILKPSELMALGIGSSDVVPCISKSIQIQKNHFGNQDFESLKKHDARVFLFSAASPHSKSVNSYIKKGELEGYHKRYLTSRRSPWYKTEFRNPSPLLLGVFSRNGYKIIKNESDAVNLTCFHGFQPNLLGKNYIDYLFLYLASLPGRDIVSLSIRKYGNGLEKFEPNDLNNSLVPAEHVFDKLPAKDVSTAVDYTKQSGVVPDWINDYFSHKLKISDEPQFHHLNTAA